MKNTEQILKFGKFKGQAFSATPTWYQEWLLKQDWFNKPMDEIGKAEKELSDAWRKLGAWDGYSRRGEAIYDSIFEAEKAMDAAYFNDPDPSSSRWNGEYTYGY